MAQAQLSQAPQSLFPVARTSTVDLIAEALRNAIFSGALDVGSPIREVDMATQLGVSRSPLREAMQRLVQERILTAVPGRGLHVSVIETGQVPDLYRARAAIEVEAVRQLAKHSNEKDLAELRGMYNELLAATTSGDARAIGDADINLHQRMVNLAGSPRLSAAMASLAIETRIAMFSLSERFAVPAEVSATYEELLTALARRDVEGAESALRRQFAEAVGRITGQEQIDTVQLPADEQPPSVEPIRG